jgi:hypothetical protein
MKNKASNSEKSTVSVFKNKFVIGPLVAGLTAILIAIATPVGENLVEFIFPTSAVVEGIVQKNGKPVVMMKLSLDHKVTATTTYSGKFLFENVSKGFHTIEFFAKDGQILFSDTFFVKKRVEEKKLDPIQMDSIPIAMKPDKIKTPAKNPAFVVEQKQPTYQVVLMHKATLIPIEERRPGFESNTRRLTIWVAGAEQVLSYIERVTYYLHPTFNPSVVTRYSRENQFALSFTAWGQFEIKAKVYFKNGQVKDISRYLFF